jgi:hypothetical protein
MPSPAERLTMTTSADTLSAEIVALYADLGIVTEKQLARVYDPQLVFRDPIHQLSGIPALCAYLNRGSQGLNSCRFEFLDIHAGPEASWMRWNMHYSHPRLKRGAALTLEGASLLQHRDKVYFQQDYYDMGAMLYEHLPLLGGAIGAIKRRMAG